MQNITRAIAGAFLQTTQWIGAPFVMKANSTLNEKFSVQSGIAPGTDQMPRMAYVAIGNGGHDLVVGAQGIAKMKPTQYKTRNAALYNHLPFVLRLPEEDLSPQDQARYGMRLIEAFNGVNYVAYYLRRIDFTNVIPVMNYHTVVNNEETVTPFSYDSTDLNPTKPPISSTGVNTVSGDYLSASAPCVLEFTVDEITELINVAQIIYQDPDLAIISELGLVSGVDKTVTSPGQGNTTINFNEVIAAQINVFVNVFYQLDFNNQGITINLDLGSSEPLFQLGPVPTGP